MMTNFHLINCFLLDHYRFLAKNFDYFYKAINEAEAKVLLKYFNVQSHHSVVDLASGTGFLAERLFERSELKNPVWCVDPSAEMQGEIKHKKGVFPLQKHADEFPDELAVDQCFNRAICIATSRLACVASVSVGFGSKENHSAPCNSLLPNCTETLATQATSRHFADAVKIYWGVESILSPGGVFLVMEGTEFSFPWFTKVENRMGPFFGERKEITSACLRLTKFDVEVTEENILFNVTKSKWYHVHSERLGYQ